MDSPEMFVGFLVFIVFPLWVTYRAQKRGYAGFALLTFLTMFVGLGLVVAVLTLFKTVKPLV